MADQEALTRIAASLERIERLLDCLGVAVGGIGGWAIARRDNVRRFGKQQGE